MHSSWPGGSADKRPGEACAKGQTGDHNTASPGALITYTKDVHDSFRSSISLNS